MKLYGLPGAACSMRTSPRVPAQPVRKTEIASTPKVFISPSPSALALPAVNRRLVAQLSGREIFRSHEERCDGLAPTEVHERSLTASPRFPLALAVSLLSFLRLQPPGFTASAQLQSPSREALAPYSHQPIAWCP